MPLAEDVSLEKIASMTEGYSGADLESLCREAGMAVLRRDRDAAYVSWADFQEALKIVKPSISPSMLKEYERLSETLRTTERPLSMIG
jgi:transitional endoplasmic reticulum ATPase